MMRQRRRDDEDQAIKTKWFSLTYKGLLLMIILALIIGLFTILVFNVGYDAKSGCYYKPNTLELKIKKSAKE